MRRRRGAVARPTRLRRRVRRRPHRQRLPHLPRHRLPHLPRRPLPHLPRRPRHRPQSRPRRRRTTTRRRRSRRPSKPSPSATSPGLLAETTIDPPPEAEAQPPEAGATAPAAAERSADDTAAPVSEREPPEQSAPTGPVELEPQKGSASAAPAAAKQLAASPATRTAGERPEQDGTRLAAPQLAVEGSAGSGLPILLLISLVVSIALLALASAPGAIARREGSVAATALGFRTEIAIGGAVLLLLTAIGFFLTA